MQKFFNYSLKLQATGEISELVAILSCFGIKNIQLPPI